MGEAVIGRVEQAISADPCQGPKNNIFPVASARNSCTIPLVLVDKARGASGTYTRKGIMKKAMRRFVAIGAAALGLATLINSASADSIFAPSPPTVTPVGLL